MVNKKSYFKFVLGILLIFSMLLGNFGLFQSVVRGESSTTSTIPKDEVFLFVGNTYAYLNNVKTPIDSSNSRVKPFKSEGKVCVPVRFIADNFNATVAWEGATSTITLKFNEKVVRFVIGSREYTVNDKKQKMEAEAQLREGRTFVPLTTLAEVFGKKVYCDDSGLIVLSDKANYFENTEGRKKAEAMIAMFKEMKRVPHVLLRSSWQVLNIGDIAHSPGVMAIIEKYLPEAEVILWASDDITPEVKEMEHKRFPKLKIVTGQIGEDGKGTNEDLDNAIQWSDFLVHGSGPSLVAYDDLKAYVKHTGKPYGVFGITYSSGKEDVRKFLSQAKFLYFRDSVSLEKAKTDGITSPIMAFGPDGAFATDLRDDKSALEFMRVNGLQEGAFLCVIPRLRYTPYWEVRSTTPYNAERVERNEVMKEHDNAPLREAIIEVVRKTGLKVVVCPEDLTQMKLGKEILVDKLPEDVKANVVWRENFWLPDEAVSLYVRSAGVFGNEMHSPIMSIGNGIPAIVCRFKEQTSKGFMWQDIGLNEWLFDLDKEEDIKKIVPAVLDLVVHPEAAKEKVKKAQAIVQERQRDMVDVLKQELDKVIK